jgi:hypothetical protein
MTIVEMEREVARHTRARDAVYARFIAEGDKAILIGVARHAVIIVELIRRIEMARR